MAISIVTWELFRFDLYHILQWLILQLTAGISGYVYDALSLSGWSHFLSEHSITDPAPPTFVDYEKE